MNMWKRVSVLGVGLVAMGVGSVAVHADEGIGMYRLYNPNSGEHFYTSNKAERNHLANIGWKYEGGAWLAPSTGDPVYRLYNPNSGDHHYTTNPEEKKMLVNVGWRYESIGWYSGGSLPVYRVYNPNAKKAGSHHYTLNKSEANQLVRAGWRDENIGWYAKGNFTPTDSIPIISNVPPRKVDVNITTAGGGEGNNPDFELCPFTLDEKNNGFVQILPSYLDMEGFFIAKFRKKNTQ